MHEMNDRVKVYRLILDVTLTPALEGASMPPPRFTQVAWSPPGLLFYGRCLLATLTNYGAVKVEYAHNRKWRTVLDVAARWADVCRLDWEVCRGQSLDQQFETLCRREAQLRIVAITWSDVRGKPPHGHYCLLAAAHRDGVVSFWHVPVVRVGTADGEVESSDAADEDAPPPPGLAFTVSTGTRLISQLHWLGLDADHLLIGDGGGCVRMWDASTPSTAEPKDAVDVYAAPDRIKVTKLADLPLAAGSSDRLVLAVKGNYVVSVLLNAAGQKLGEDVRHFQHLAITGLVVTGPGTVVLSAREGVFYRMECSFSDGSLRTALSSVPTNLNFTYNACFGLAASPHRMIWVAAASVCKLYDHLVVKQPTAFHFMTVVDPAEAVPMLVENASFKLTGYLDCLETLRVQCQKMSHRPPIDVTAVDLDTLNDYQLRLSLWLACIGLSIIPDNELDQYRELKELQHRIRQLIFARHACRRVQRILSAVVKRGASEEELNSINLLRTWMLNFTEDPVAASHWTQTCGSVSTILEGSQGLEELIKEYCHICEAEVQNTWVSEEQWLFAKCSNGHSVPRCSLSLLPCVSLPYFTCLTCRTSAHPACVLDGEPLCVFCDSILRLDEAVSLDSALP